MQRYTDTGSKPWGEGCDGIPLKTDLLALLKKVGTVKPSCRIVILTLTLLSLTAQTQPFHLFLKLSEGHLALLTHINHFVLLSYKLGVVHLCNFTACSLVMTDST